MKVRATDNDVGTSHTILWVRIDADKRIKRLDVIGLDCGQFLLQNAHLALKPQDSALQRCDVTVQSVQPV